MAAAAAAVLLQAQDESRAAAAKPVNEPQHLVLPGGTRLPLLGLGTFQLQSADAVRKALERELCGVVPGLLFILCNCGAHDLPAAGPGRRAQGAGARVIWQEGASQ